MKKTLIALSLFAFIGGTAIAGYTAANDNAATEVLTDGGKEKDKKKKKKSADCAEGEAAKEGEKAKSCSKDAKKSCCAKKKADS